MAMAEKDKELIRDSWESLGKNKIPHGVIMFNRMFELEPSLRALFNFDTTYVGDKVSNAALLDHITKVMLVLDVAVKNLDNLLALKDYLVKLGRKHAAAGVSVKAFGVVGESLLYMLQCSLGDAYSAPLQQAWLNLYTIVEAVMSQGWPTNSEHQAV